MSTLRTAFAVCFGLISGLGLGTIVRASVDATESDLATISAPGLVHKPWAKDTVPTGGQSNSEVWVDAGVTGQGAHGTMPVLSASNSDGASASDGTSYSVVVSNQVAIKLYILTTAGGWITASAWQFSEPPYEMPWLANAIATFEVGFDVGGANELITGFSSVRQVPSPLITTLHDFPSWRYCDSDDEALGREHSIQGNTTTSIHHKVGGFGGGFTFEPQVKIGGRSNVWIGMAGSMVAWDQTATPAISKKTDGTDAIWVIN